MTFLVIAWRFRLELFWNNLKHLNSTNDFEKIVKNPAASACGCNVASEMKKKNKKKHSLFDRVQTNDKVLNARAQSTDRVDDVCTTEDLYAKSVREKPLWTGDEKFRNIGVHSVSSPYTVTWLFLIPENTQTDFKRIEISRKDERDESDYFRTVPRTL